MHWRLSSEKVQLLGKEGKEEQQEGWKGGSML